MNKKKIWSLNFSISTFLLLPAAIGINYIGKLFAQLLNLPLWFDSIGTIFSAILGGPVIGAASGLLNNIMYGLLDPVSFIYGITSVSIGLLVGVLARKGFVSNWYKALLMGVFVAAVAAIVSTPLNIMLWGGGTGIGWSDTFFGIAEEAANLVWLRSFAAELAVDLPDKILSVLAGYALYKVLPESVVKYIAMKG